MAVLAFAALGSALGATAITGTFLGLSGASLGWLAGSVIGNALFNKPPDQQGPRITDTKTDAGAYSQPIFRLWGAGVITGETIWMSRDLIETQHTTSTGGKGGGGSYKHSSYAVNMLVRFCYTPKIGQNPMVRRIVANGILIYDSAKLKPTDDRYIKEMDLVISYGHDTDPVDPTYAAEVGAANAPAHLGYITVSFTNLQLTDAFGNRPPIIKAEIYTDATITGGATITTFPYPTIPGSYFDWGGVDPLTGELIGHTYNSSLLSTQIIRFDSSTGAYIATFTGTPIPSNMNLGDGIGVPEYQSIVNASAITGKVHFFDQMPIVPPPSSAAINTFDLASSSFESQIIDSIFTTVIVNPYDGSVWSNISSSGGDFKHARVIPGPLFTITITPGASEGYGFMGVFHFISATEAVVGQYSRVDGTHALWKVNLITGAAAVMGITPWPFNIRGFDGVNIWGVSPNNDFGLWNVTTNVFQEWPLPDTAGGNSYNNWASVSNGLFFYYIYTSTVNKLMAWDVATHTKVGEYLLTPGDYIDWGDTTSPIGYFGVNGTFVIKWVQATPTITQNQYSLAAILTEISELSGLSAADIDVSECLSTTVKGYAVSGLTTGRGMAEQLLMVYGFDAVRSGYKVAFRSRSRAPVATLTQDDFLVSTENKMEIQGTLEMPHTALLSYTDADTGEYGVGTQTATLQTVNATASLQVQTAVVLTAQEARALVWKILVTAWLENKSFKRSVSVKWAKLEPGDIVTLPLGSETINARIQRITDSGIRRDLELVSVLTDGYSQPLVGSSRPSIPPVVLGGVKVMYPMVMDIPPLRTADDGLFVYVAAISDSPGTWQGGILQKSNDGGLTWHDSEIINERAAHGVMAANLLSPPYHGGAGILGPNELVGVIDMMHGQLSSVTQSDMLKGKNIMYLKSAGSEEVLEFDTASLTGTNRYGITNIVRDILQISTGLSASVGDKIVMMDQGGIVLAKMTRQEIFTNVQFRILSNNQDLDSAPVITLNYRGRSMAPRAPIVFKHRRANQGGNFDAPMHALFVLNSMGGGALIDRLLGGLEMTWIKRSLRNLYWNDGKNFTPLEGPIEKYQVEVWQIAGLTPLATYEITSLHWTYTAVQQIIDFPIIGLGGPSTIVLKIRAYSNYFGSYDYSEVGQFVSPENIAV